MASRREEVLEALKALVAAALSGAKVARNSSTPSRIGPGGDVIIRDGDPGEPEVQLSPLTYTYSHRIALEVAGYDSAAQTPEQVLDGMLTTIGLAIQANRTLGGLCEWLEPDAPSTDDIDPTGSAATRWASLGVLAVYSTPNPLT